MSYSLLETLGQIDRFVNLSDGFSVHAVYYWLNLIDPADTAEYVLRVDPAGRLLIHRLDFAGYIISPPVFFEEKQIARHHAWLHFGAMLALQSPPGIYM